MYYPWTWWLSWLIPMAFVAWAAFGWGGGRHRDTRYRPYVRDDWDDHWSWPRRGSANGFRNRGPLNYHRSDARIAEDINDRLLLDEDIDPSAMMVQVKDGSVTLRGTVETRFQKRLADRIADSVAGVTDVENQLRIGRIDHMSQPANSTPLANAPATSASAQ